MNDEILKKTFQTIDKIIVSHKNYEMEETNKILALTNIFNEKYKEEKSKQPYHINLIDELHANENAHSRILVKLLHYKQDGKYPLLMGFLESLTHEYKHFNFSHFIKNPIITSEKHRIDALIIDRDYAIIIENKIHGAKDQPDQIKRYIDTITTYNIPEDSLYILYMTSWGGKPTEDSFPLYLREKFKNRYLSISYRYDIINWLEVELRNPFRKTEEFLDSTLLQYLDHLNGLYQIRKIDEPMKKEMIKLLESQLNLSGNLVDDLGKIDETLENIVNVKQSMEELRIIKYFLFWENQIKLDFPSNLNKIVFNYSETYPKVGITIEYKELSISILIEKDEDGVYYGLANVNEEERIEALEALLKNEFSGLEGPRNKWYRWEYLPYNNIYPKFQLFAKSILEKLQLQ